MRQIYTERVDSIEMKQFLGKTVCFCHAPFQIISHLRWLLFVAVGEFYLILIAERAEMFAI